MFFKLQGELRAIWGRAEKVGRSSFEGFFASKGAAYALPDGDFARQATKHGGEMQLHLQAMVNLLRDEDVLRLVVKLESQYPNRIRYLTIVSAFGQDEEEQSIVMGVDWTDKATIGLVIPLYRDTTINLDGDGTALQWIHKCSENARKHNYYYLNESSHAWVEYYYRKISSDRLRINEWFTCSRTDVNHKMLIGHYRYTSYVSAHTVHV
ncbi:protein phosphatase Slingshot homolog 2-like [Orbicella faveolata]|uniref:protein phosphatase Slingshot homolog 2-like n=1 Tax=Orbicella faveolata TaxID=48498 RepID=UPI0009E4A125|nr:protein phosphatase Slingshot homolog 2-like [Orbicella faveolata]